jgi:hypothetical protein
MSKEVPKNEKLPSWPDADGTDLLSWLMTVGFASA